MTDTVAPPRSALQQPPQQTPPGSRKLVAGLTALAIGLVSILAWLFGPSAAAPKAPVDVASLPSTDGTLVVVDLPRLVLKTFRPVDGKREVEFTVREADKANFDVAHLRSHSSIGLPTRVYFERDGDRYFAVYKEDAPANSSREAQP